MKELTGRHVLFSLLGFFGLIIGVNAVMITAALQSFSGETIEKAYVKGLNYNDEAAARAEQAERGWTGALETVRRDGSAAVTIAIRTKDGAPVTGLSAAATLRHPVRAAFDQTTLLSEIRPGVYAADVPDIGAGQWDVAIAASDPNDSRITFAAERRVWLP